MITRRDFLSSSALAVGGLALSGSAPANVKQTVSHRISLNVSTIRFYKLPVEQQIEVCGKAGFDGVELWTSDLTAYREKGGTWREIASRLKDNRLILDNIISFVQWAIDDQTRREAGFEQMKREMEMTAELGGKYIAAPFGGVNSLEAGIDVYAERFLRIIELGKSIGVTPLLEHWGHNVISKLGDAVKLCIATGHADANLLLDFYHLYRGGNSLDSLNLLNLARLPVFHMNDYPADPPREQLNDRHRMYPGDGICPFRTAIPMLRKGGFTGSFSVELFNDEYCKDNTVQQVLATTLEKTRRVLAY